MDTLNQLRQFFPTGPNLAPYMPLAPFTAIVIGVILGGLIVAGLWWLIIGAGIFGVAGRNMNRRGEGVDTMQHGLKMIVLPFVAGAILTGIGFFIAQLT